MSRPRVTRKEFDALSRRIEALDRQLADVASMLAATYRRGARRRVHHEIAELTEWDLALDLIAERVNSYSFFTWFRDTRLLADDGRTVSIEVPDAMTARWLTSHYADLIDESLADAGRIGATVRIVVAGTVQSSS